MNSRKFFTISLTLLLCSTLSLYSIEPEELLEQANSYVSSSYNVPSWVNFLIHKKKANTELSETNIAALSEAMNNLESCNKPFNINMTINGDPSSQIGFTWYTNQGIDNTRLEIVETAENETPNFNAFAQTYTPSTTTFSTNYIVSGNTIGSATVASLTGLANNSKQSYTSNKVLVTNLSPNSRYAYRVGGIDNEWCYGTFRTTSDQKEPFTFIYITDTQANSDDNFNISQKTISAAYNKVPDAKFLLITGDMVETSGGSNSEWEWEQWFSKMQNTWFHLPIAPIVGNHDTSTNKNFERHFNTSNDFNDSKPAKTSDTNGSNYHFIIGDALFMVIEFETGMGLNGTYNGAVAKWLRTVVNNNSSVKWKIVCFHKNIYTGAKHQSDTDIKTVRNALAPVFDELKINLALQGHDHVYEVIGPVYGKKLVANSVYQVLNSDISGVNQNMTGKEGGVYNTLNGTLYFVNNSAGRKKYDPKTEKEMKDGEGGILGHGVSNYWNLFTGKLAQTGEPTFSKVAISNDKISIETYAYTSEENIYLFDQFDVVNNDISTEQSNLQLRTDKRVWVENQTIQIEGATPESIELYEAGSGELCRRVENSNRINTKGIKGLYIVKFTEQGNTYVSKIMIN